MPTGRESRTGKEIGHLRDISVDGTICGLI